MNIRSTRFRHIKKHLVITIPQLPSRSNIRWVPFRGSVERQHKIEERLGKGFYKCCNINFCSASENMGKWDNPVITFEKARTTLGNRSEHRSHAQQVVQQIHPEERI